jgi:hypothetical protein
MRIIHGVAVSAAFLLTGVSAEAASTNYPAIQSTIKYARTSSGASGYGNFARATSKVVYDPATGIYTVRDTGSVTTTSSFGPANINSAASDATFTVYKKGTAETLRLFNQSASNPLIVLSYVTYGQWRRTSTSGSTTSVNDTYLVFGNKSPASAVVSGTATYSTVLDGTFVNKTGAYTVGGTGTFNADFGAGTINYSSTATGTPESAGSAINFGTMTGMGSIARKSASFSGTGSANGSGYAMDVNGSFYGPAAQEVGGVFRIHGGGGNGIGAIVGN